ncbi:MAG: hypothetical protein C4522_22140 [Desulfobacteraceae bacterium]|nr:MAG: hypothetical protein C4522_22140 [Desulfobacteraceae bacterium]
MNIHFIIENWSENERAKIEAAACELLIRIGIPFVLHRSGSTVPADGFSIRYADIASSSNFTGYDLPVAGDFYADTNKDDAREYHDDDSIIWAAKVGQSYDIIAGSYHLLS